MRLPRLLLLPLILFSAGLYSCAPKGPQPPKPGTPQYFWAAAQTAWQKGDFSQTSARLRELTSSQNEYQDRARTWQMIVSAGLARGEMEWADVLDEGRKNARSRQIDFLRQASAVRTAASQNAMRFAEAGHAYSGQAEMPDVVLAFPMPPGSAEKPADLARVSKGMILPAAELENDRVLMQQRGVLLELAHIAGSHDDVQKASAMLAPGEATVKRDALLLYLAHTFADLTELYAPKKLDQAGRMKLFCNEAQEALSFLKPTKETSELQKKIEAILKKLPKTAG